MEWREVVGYGGRYLVSDSGEIKTDCGRIAKQFVNDQGYSLVRVSGPRKVLRVHRVVAQAFIPNPKNLSFVNHIDCIRNSNSVENLEWCTQWENLNHSQLLGRMPRNYWKGKRSPNALLSDAQVVEIRRIYALGGTSFEQLGKVFEISKRAIGRIIKGETYAVI